MKHNRICKFTFIVLAFFISLTAVAQTTMTDEQILEYLVAESQKGASEQKMAADLIKRGVTPTQLQRVRTKAQKMQAAASTEASKTVAEKRTDEVGVGTNKDKIDAGDADKVAGVTETGQRQVFGRNIFNSKNLTFQPSANIATPTNYIIGAGDVVTINIWGASQKSIEARVTSDGYIVIGDVGPVRLAGLSVSNANNMLSAKLGQYYNDCDIQLSLTEARSVQVQVMGEVMNPGTYTLSSLSTAFNALYTAGGISRIGTLRDIKVYRSGKLISTIDVYDYILNGNSRGDVRLEDNDVIVVGAYDCLVQVKGNVKRPMWYEMKRSETVGDVIKYAGSFSGDAYTKNIRLTRKNGDQYSIHTVGEFEMNAFNLADEDMVEVDSIRARFSNRVEIRGAAKHAGLYELGKEINSVRTLLLAADGLSEDAYEGRAIMHRENPDLTLQMIGIDVHGIIAGTASDVPLKNNDVLFIPSKTDMLGERMVSVYGEVVYPGQYPYADSTTVQDIILQTGGITERGTLAKVDIYRRIGDRMEPIGDRMEPIGDRMEPIGDKDLAKSWSFSLNPDFSISEDTVFYLEPHDMVVVRKSPSYETQQYVSVVGEVKYTGNHVLTHKNFRLSELIEACGGLTHMAYPRDAKLTRTMTPEEIKRRNEINLKSQIQLYEDGLKEGRELNLQIADSLLSLKANTSNKYVVAIDLQEALANPGSQYDLILREGDLLQVPTFNNTIKISGEVMNPVSITYEKGRNLAYYINHAGGYANNASKRKVYGIHANGSVVKLSSNSVRDIQPGMEIVVPQKNTKRKLSTSEIIGIGSGVAALASVIVALLNIIK